MFLRFNATILVLIITMQQTYTSQETNIWKRSSTVEYFLRGRCNQLINPTLSREDMHCARADLMNDQQYSKVLKEMREREELRILEDQLAAQESLSIRLQKESKEKRRQEKNNRRKELFATQPSAIHLDDDDAR